MYDFGYNFYRNGHEEPQDQQQYTETIDKATGQEPEANKDNNNYEYIYNNESEQEQQAHGNIIKNYHFRN